MGCISALYNGRPVVVIVVVGEVVGSGHSTPLGVYVGVKCMLALTLSLIKFHRSRGRYFMCTTRGT